MRFWVLTIVSLLLSVLGSAEQCGWQADGALCLGRGGGGVVGDIGGIISEDMFNDLLKHRNDNACEGKGFYSYEAFLTASKAYPAFGTTGDDATRKKEIAAFLAQTSHETTGGWPSAPDGPYSWGYCFVTERNPPPGPGQYYGRGPIQLTWNYNYALAGEALGVDLISNPNLVATNAVISFKTAFWFWMTAQSPKPSSHDVIIGSWSPSAVDTEAGRVPGYGVITNIINGGNECGKGPNQYGEDRIGFFRKYCQILGADTGDNLDCYNQEPFGSGLLLDTI